jgi:polysaccharide deacetylase family protein (PEP-CTERM system associated)
VIRHHLTVDVEEFFHSTTLAKLVPQARWDAMPRRAPIVVDWLLERLDAADATATFFVLGWLAEREPDVVRAIAGAGHEVASHGWDHRKITDQSPEEFRHSLRRTRDLLESLSGQPVRGFRAPSFSIGPGMEWAFDVLLEEGHTYDSSLFPISVHPGYGYPAASRDPDTLQRPGGCLVEIPPLTLGVGPSRLPAAGGAYLRFFPYALVRTALRQAERRGVPGTIYVHPWDLDPDIARLPLRPLHTLRLHGGAGRARKRLVRLLAEFRFTSIARSLEGGLVAGVA